MEQYKICPFCGAKNKPNLLECTGCESDLTGVKITDDSAEERKKEAKSKAEETPDASNENTVRICDCGAKNLPNARKCSACGEDISDITPTPDVDTDTDTVAESEIPFMLTSVDGKYAFEIKPGEIILGREAGMKEYLESKAFVSRKHCKLINDGNNLFVENISQVNFTYVNNDKIVEKTRLSDGDELELGGISKNGYQDKAAYFIVRISKCM